MHPFARGLFHGRIAMRPAQCTQRGWVGASDAALLRMHPFGRGIFHGRIAMRPAQCIRREWVGTSDAALLRARNPASHTTVIYPTHPAVRFSCTPRQSSGERVLIYHNSRPRTGTARPRPACAGRGLFSKNRPDYSWTVTDWSSNSATSWRATVSSMPMVLAASSNMTIQNGQATAMVSGCSVRSCSRRMTLVFLSP